MGAGGSDPLGVIHPFEGEKIVQGHEKLWLLGRPYMFFSSSLVGFPQFPYIMLKWLSSLLIDAMKEAQLEKGAVRAREKEAAQGYQMSHRRQT